MTVDPRFVVNVVFGALGAALVVWFGFLAWRAIRAQPKPLFIPLVAWKQALVYPFRQPHVALMMAAIGAVGVMLQSHFVNDPAYDEMKLLYLSIFWQALLASMMAMLAVPFAQYLIALEPYDAVFRPDDAAPMRRRQTKLYAMAAAAGFAVWTLLYLLTVGARAVGAYAPSFVQRPLATSAGVVVFVVGAVLTFVRPAIVSGYARPLAAALRLSRRRLAAVCLLTALMALPPMAFELFGVGYYRFLPPTLAVVTVFDVIGVVFNVFQFLAVEATALILFRSCVVKSAPDSEPQRAAMPLYRLYEAH
jgi:hypothetical protein